jgi:hypothetical protein
MAKLVELPDGQWVDPCAVRRVYRVEDRRLTSRGESGPDRFAVGIALDGSALVMVYCEDSAAEVKARAAIARAINRARQGG